MKHSVSKIIFQILPILLFAVQQSTAQSSRKLIHEGNKKYEAKKYGEAEIDYRKSINTKENPFIGNYNLGNAYYQQGKYNEAKQQFETAAGEKSASKEQLSKAYHNLGNSLLKAEKYEESLQAYKQALKLNPKDNDTRYNLAYAQSKLQQQQQQQQQNKDNKDQNNKDQKQNQDSQNKQDKKDQQKDKEQQEQEQEQNQANDQKEKKEQQAKKDKISKEDAEKILQALNNDEKKTQKKLNVKESVRVQIEKEW
jgi:tetratricopeptide (TPR) repeat protein